jgi:hypothetical protein
VERLETPVGLLVYRSVAATVAPVPFRTCRCAVQSGASCCDRTKRFGGRASSDATSQYRARSTSPTRYRTHQAKAAAAGSLVAARLELLAEQAPALSLRGQLRRRETQRRTQREGRRK